MPSREPFETTIETFSIVLGSEARNPSSRWSGVYIIVISSSSDTAFRLRNSADPGGELGRPLGEERVQLLDGDSGLLAQRADRGSASRRQVALPHEPDDQP